MCTSPLRPPVHCQCVDVEKEEARGSRMHRLSESHTQAKSSQVQQFRSPTQKLLGHNISRSHFALSPAKGATMWPNPLQTPQPCAAGVIRSWKKNSERVLRTSSPPHKSAPQQPDPHTTNQLHRTTEERDGMKRFYPTILLLAAASPSLGQDVSLTTGFAGTNQANGNIFTIKAKSQPISIKRFDVNMSGPPAPNPAPTEVYFLPAIDPGYQDTQTYPYQKIFDGMVDGQGKGSVTPLPAFDSPVVIPAGATYSFYITTVGLQLGTNLWYNIGSNVGDVVASDANIEVGEGWALGYPFLGYSDQRRWNGNVHYSVGAGSPAESTASPTMLPTQSPVTPSPTLNPTPAPQPNEDTLDPTVAPTRSPVDPPTGPSPSGGTESPTTPPVSSPTGPTDVTPAPTVSNDGDDDESLTPPTKAPVSSPSQPTSSGATTPSPTTRPTVSQMPSSFGPTSEQWSFLPNEPEKPTSSSFKAGHQLTGQLVSLALLGGVVAFASYLSF
ncbi:hypothetical protein ACHAXT_011102 [Thalassiosira profunda]